jgi:hypothetical protein
MKDESGRGPRHAPSDGRSLPLLPGRARAYPSRGRQSNDERLESKAQDIFTGQGVRSSRKSGLLAMRAAGAATRLSQMQQASVTNI